MFFIARSHTLPNANNPALASRGQYNPEKRATLAEAVEFAKNFLKQPEAKAHKHSATVWREGNENASCHYWLNKDGEIEERRDIVTPGDLRSRLAIALLNSERHNDGICMHNHDIDYSHGWFTIDGGAPFRRPDLTQKARELFKQGVRASLVRNSYAIVE